MEKMRVLYVDDEPINLELFKLNFDKEFEISLFENPYLALKEFNPYITDVVLSDLRMPGMNGIELIGELKKIAPAIPCIILTAYMDPQAMMEAINKHLIFKYVMKPWERTSLKGILEEAVRGVI